jgi:acyl dehydratase
LPDLVLRMTATRIAAGAIATRDFMPVHHDKAYANAQGAPDIFMNILSTNSYCSRYLTDWAGPDAILRHLSIRLGVPVFPDSILTFRGEVTGVHEERGEKLVNVSFSARTDLGNHATGTATLSLPNST